MNLNKRSGFTLLEIIIVIIIVGILASLALPRFYRTVEYSRSTEALASIASLRQSIERCFLPRATYVGCVIANLDMEDPATSPGNHFTYFVSGPSATGYTITATRNTRAGGKTTHHIYLQQTSANVTRAGDGAFAGIQ